MFLLNECDLHNIEASGTKQHVVVLGCSLHEISASGFGQVCRSYPQNKEHYIAVVACQSKRRSCYHFALSSLGRGCVSRPGHEFSCARHNIKKKLSSYLTCVAGLRMADLSDVYNMPIIHYTCPIITNIEKNESIQNRELGREGKIRKIALVFFAAMF